jgi:hypothetical protein
LALNEGQNAGVESVLAGGGQIDKAKRLQPALRGPHGEHDFGWLANRRLTEMEDQLDLQLFIERPFQVHKAASDGELMQVRSYLPLVRQSNENQNGAA